MHTYFDNKLGTVVLNSLDACVDTNQRGVMNRLMDAHVKLARELNATALGRNLSAREVQQLDRSEAEMLTAATCVDPLNISRVDAVLTGSEALLDYLPELRTSDLSTNHFIAGKDLDELGRYVTPSFILKADKCGFSANNFMPMILQRAARESEFRELAREMISCREDAVNSLARGGLTRGSGHWANDHPELVAELLQLHVHKHPSAAFHFVEEAALENHWKLIVGMVLAGLDVTRAKDRKHPIISGFDTGEMKELVRTWDTDFGKAELLDLTGDLAEFLAHQDRADAVRKLLMKRAPHIGLHAGHFDAEDSISIDDLDDDAPGGDLPRL